jgi:hypothetical protein
MNCLKSFTIHSSSNINTSAGKIWLQNGNSYWILDTNLSSSFIIEGFKNINIHGVEIIGALEGNTSGSDRAIVSDWGTTLQLQGGTIPQVSGRINTTPNNWSIDNTSAFARLFTLGKYQNKVMFASPFESVKSINFLNLNAQGNGSLSLVSLDLKWNFQWVFYYTYEGEQY